MLYRKSKDTFYVQQLFRKSCLLGNMWRKYVKTCDWARPVCWVETMRFACRMTKSRTHTHTHTHTIFKIYCFSTPTMVTRSRFNVTLYVRCLHRFDRAKLFNHEQNVSPDTINTTSLCNYHARNHNHNTLAHTSTNCDLSKEWCTYSIQLHCGSHQSEAANMEYTKKKALQTVHVTGQCRPLTIKT